MTITEYLNCLHSLFKTSLSQKPNNTVILQTLLENLTQDMQRPPSATQDPDNVLHITQGLGLTFVTQKEGEGEVCFAHSPEVRPEFRQTFAPIDLLDYLYAVLHSSAYRENYKEPLTKNFSQLPYPKDTEQFWKLTAMGTQLRQLHLLDRPVQKTIWQYPIPGDNTVSKISFEENYEIIEKDCMSMINPIYRMGRVYLNETQFFQSVPLQVWELYIGGCQPAQQWLKDHKGHKLQFDQILHYQRLVEALFKTAGLMEEIDDSFGL